jgi:GNAT superfamily N-acetyltransferase
VPSNAPVAGHDVRVEARRPDLEEARAIAEVWLRSRAASVPAIPRPVHTDDEVRSYFDVVVATKDVWVIDERGAIAALLVLDGERIDQLYVDPDHTGKGHGSSLIAVAKRQRPAGLELWTFEANIRARRFYERHGFVVTGGTDGENEEGAPDVHYEWRPSTSSDTSTRTLRVTEGHDLRTPVE